MGGIVKSIGRSVKKLGKSVGRFLKKYRTTIILAAALWAGLGAFGASASGASIWSPASVSAGVKQIFGFGTGVGTKMLSPTDAGYFDQLTKVGKYSGDMVKSKSILSGLKEWFKDMPDWGKYALTQTGMTIVGSMLDTSAEDEMAAKYGGMGRKYGQEREGPSVFEEHPEWAVGPPPSWPAAPTTTSQTSTPQQAQLARAPGVVGKPRSQQITAMRTTPLDVRPPGMLSGRSPGLIQMGANQRRYA